VCEPAGDRPFQTPNAVEATAADGLAGDQFEPAFDQVEPRGTGRSEVQMEARVGVEPTCDRRMFVGAVIVADQMQLKSRIAFGQRFQEGDELDVGVALETAPMDLLPRVSEPLTFSRSNCSARVFSNHRRAE
jgi:hypothetical protein